MVGQQIWDVANRRENMRKKVTILSKIKRKDNVSLAYGKIHMKMRRSMVSFGSLARNEKSIYAQEIAHFQELTIQRRLIRDTRTVQFLLYLAEEIST